MEETVKPVQSAQPVRAAKEVANKRRLRTNLKRHVRASLILGLSAVVCAVSMVCVFLSLKAISVSHTLRVAGILQAVEQSTPIKHDRGGIIGGVFVTDGEVVREGQILASLNTDDLQEELQAARSDVAGLLLRARCLRALKDEQMTLNVPEKLKQVMGQLQQIKQMRRVSVSCQSKLEQQFNNLNFKRAELRAAYDVMLLHRRLAETQKLVNDTGEEIQAFAADAEPSSKETVRALNNLLLQSIKASKAKVSYEDLSTKLKNEILKRHTEIDRELGVISDQLQEAQAELTRMENLLRDKFIYASTSGRVQRMRIKEPGRRIAAGAYVLEIAPLQTDFEVTSEIGLAEAPNLGVGQLVHVQLSGGLPKPIWVPARIEKILKTSENNRLLSIRMAREDLNKRDLLYGDNSLNGLGERSEAVISVNSETAWQSLSGTLRNVFFNRGRESGTEV